MQIRILILILLSLTCATPVAQAGPLANLWYRCEAYLKNDTAYLEAWKQSNPAPQISTGRLTIKPLETRDEIAQLRSVEAAVATTLIESLGSLNYESIENKFIPAVVALKRAELIIVTQFAIWDKLSGKIVGIIQSAWFPRSKTLKFGGGILPDFRRTGLAREARIGLMQHYAKLGVETFETTIANTNLPSIQLSKSLGFRPKQIMVIEHNWKLVDATLFTLPADQIPPR